MKSVRFVEPSTLWNHHQHHPNQRQLQRRRRRMILSKVVDDVVCSLRLDGADIVWQHCTCEDWVWLTPNRRSNYASWERTTSLVLHHFYSSVFRLPPSITDYCGNLYLWLPVSYFLHPSRLPGREASVGLADTTYPTYRLLCFVGTRATGLALHHLYSTVSCLPLTSTQ
jgi:hypothetical protein